MATDVIVDTHAEQSGYIDSRNPATGEVIGRVRVTPVDEVEESCRRAAAAQQEWAARPIARRAAIIDRAADYVLHNARRYGDLLRRENGKPFGDAILMEVGPTVESFRWLARHAPRILADEQLRPDLLTLAYGMRHLVRHEPLGVVAIISPWNYPLSIPAGEVAAALVAGNAVVLKPAPLTPLIADALAEAFTAAGLPDDVLQVVHGDAEQGQALCASPHTDKVIFTGSVEVGYLVAQACALHLKPYTLELGGKDPAIVRADADLDRAIPQILWCGIANAGQTCAGVERVYAHESVYDEVVRRLVAQASHLQVGDPIDADVEIGAITDPRQYDKIVELVDDAVAHGATRHTGGPVVAHGEGDGHFYGPTILTGVDHTMRIMREEIFGPVIPVISVRSDDEAIALANDSTFGLGASIWTRDRRAARAIAERLEAGMVWVNEHMYSHAAPMAPWGGVKDSGYGRVHSKYGLYAVTEQKLISRNVGPLPVAAFPHDEASTEATLTMMRLMLDRGRDRLTLAWRGRSDIVRYLRHRIAATREDDYPPPGR